MKALPIYGTYSFYTYAPKDSEILRCLFTSSSRQAWGQERIAHKTNMASVEDLKDGELLPQELLGAQYDSFIELNTELCPLQLCARTWTAAASCAS